MKILITEQQLKEIEENQVKKMLFKYWDLYGPNIDDNFKKILGINIGESDIKRIFREYLGPEKIKEILYKFLGEKKHKIDDCGGYNFEFEIINLEIEDYQVSLEIAIDDIEGTVMLLMIDGSILKIKDARKEEFGWEIENETEDCVFEYISKNLDNKTGIGHVLYKVKYYSDMPSKIAK